MKTNVVTPFKVHRFGQNFYWRYFTLWSTSIWARSTSRLMRLSLRPRALGGPRALRGKRKKGEEERRKERRGEKKEKRKEKKRRGKRKGTKKKIVAKALDGQRYPCPALVGCDWSWGRELGSGPKGVNDLCFHSYGEFSPSPPFSLWDLGF